MGIVIGPLVESQFWGFLYWLVILLYSLCGLEVENMNRMSYGTT